jgi:hypothetical protein
VTPTTPEMAHASLRLNRRTAAVGKVSPMADRSNDNHVARPARVKSVEGFHIIGHWQFQTVPADLTSGVGLCAQQLDSRENRLSGPITIPSGAHPVNLTCDEESGIQRDFPQWIQQRQGQAATGNDIAARA